MYIRLSGVKLSQIYYLAESNLRPPLKSSVKLSILNSGLIVLFTSVFCVLIYKAAW